MLSTRGCCATRRRDTLILQDGNGHEPFVSSKRFRERMRLLEICYELRVQASPRSLPHLRVYKGSSPLLSVPTHSTSASADFKIKVLEFHVSAVSLSFRLSKRSQYRAVAVQPQKRPPVCMSLLANTGDEHALHTLSKSLSLSTILRRGVVV